MGLLDPANRSELQQSPEKASQAVESLMLQRMLSSCHLMGKSNAPGAGMRSDLFVEALSDAVTKSGGMGLAKEILAQSGPHPAASGAASGEKNDSTEKNISMPNLPTSGRDLETELLSHQGSLIGNSKRADNSLGEP